MNDEKYHVVIQGTRPLLHNRYPMPTAQSAGHKARKGTVFNAEADAKACLYLKPNSDVPYQLILWRSSVPPPLMWSICNTLTSSEKPHLEHLLPRRRMISFRRS